MLARRLSKLIEELEAWASELGYHPEWCDPSDFPRYIELISLVEKTLDVEELRDDEIAVVLHALALDGLLERVQDLLRERPRLAIQVALAGIDYPSKLARWQLGALAGEFAREETVLRYLVDEDEYVRRRTLLAARHRFPATAQAFAIAWLDAKEPYSRMVALDTLRALDSPLFPPALQRLSQDQAEVVLARIRKWNAKPR